MIKAGLAAVIAGCAAVALAFGVALMARPGVRATVAAAVVTPAYPAVTNARLLEAAKDDGWLMFLRAPLPPALPSRAVRSFGLDQHWHRSRRPKPTKDASRTFLRTNNDVDWQSATNTPSRS